MIGSYQDSVQMFGCRLTYYQSDIQSRQSPLPNSITARLRDSGQPPSIPRRFLPVLNSQTVKRHKRRRRVKNEALFEDMNNSFPIIGVCC